MNITKHNIIYRLPYQGSKNKIAYDILKAINKESPQAEIFIDLFGGGGSITTSALQNGYSVIYNEYDKGIYSLFAYCIESKELQNYDSKWWRFIDRETFYKLLNSNPKKDEDIAYREGIVLCYSFGNNRSVYFCNADKEVYKKNGHLLVMNCDKQAAAFFCKRYSKTLGHLFYEYIELIKTIDNRKERRQIFVNLMLKMEGIRVAYEHNKAIFKLYKDFDLIKLLEYPQIKICEDIDKYCPLIPKKEYRKCKDKQQLQRLEQLEHLHQLQQLEHLERLKELKELQQLQRLDQLEQLQQLERLQRLKQLERLEQLQQLEQLERLQQLERLEQLKKNKNLSSKLAVMNFDYEEAFLMLKPFIDKDKNKFIIYCDPPYVNTEGYKTDFDHDRFKNFLSTLHQNNYKVFLSEYTNYNNYKELLKREKRITLGQKNKDGIERLFVNIPIDNYKPNDYQYLLFN